MSQSTLDKITTIIEELEEVKGKIEENDEYSFPLDSYLTPVASNTRILSTAVDAQVEMIKGTQ